jgi:hypothetical protein
LSTLPASLLHCFVDADLSQRIVFALRFLATIVQAK